MAGGSFYIVDRREREQPDASGRVQSRERKQTGCGYFSGVLGGRGQWRHDDKEKLQRMNIERGLFAIPKRVVPSLEA